MATDVVIPGEDLQKAADNLGLVQQHIDTAAGGTDLRSVLGPDLGRSAEDFESHWSDGRKQLHRECQKIQDAIQKIEDAFQKADDQVASGLSQGS